MIEIIRTEDEPKPVMIAEFALTDRQAEAILNMRLRSLRKLEEMEIGKERAALAKEREELAKLVESPARQRTPAEARPGGAQGQVRRRAADPDRGSCAPAREIDWSAMIEKEPITVILSQRGWIRAMKGHLALEQVADLKWREGDGPFIHFHAQTTDRLALFASTMGGSTRWPATSCPAGAASASRCGCSSTSMPRSRSSQLLVVRPDMKLLVASSDGQGLRHQRRSDAGRDAQGQAAGQPAPRGAGSRWCARSPTAPTRSR